MPPPAIPGSARFCSHLVWTLLPSGRADALGGFLMKRYLALMILVISPVFAEEPPTETFIDEYDESTLDHGDTYARITFADKEAYLTREDQTEEPLIRNMPVTSGDFLETRPASFAEIEFIDGSLMQFDRGTRVEFQAINEVHGKDNLSIIKIHDGSIFLHVVEVNPDEQTRVFRFDTEAGSAYIEAAGIYEITMEAGRMKLKVFRGFAELSGEEDSVPVYSGEYSTIRNLRRPIRANAFNSFHTNRFERWAYSRRPVTESVSSDYVDSSIASYSRDLDDAGEWRYEEGLRTQIWVPYVESSWRPYNNGYWTTCNGVLTWVPYDSFGWVTHHYGRWGWNIGLGWYWIPGYHYSPAWVAWSSYDSYVGWCPLGYYNRPYYYNAYGRPVWGGARVQNNYWTYVSSTVIINRSRNYTVRNVSHSGTRAITTRSVHVKRDDFRDSRGFLKVIRDPEENRTRARVATSNRKGTMVVRDRTQAERVKITGRSTGARAVPRYLPEPGKTSRARVQPSERDAAAGRGVVRTSRPTSESKAAPTVRTRETVQRGSSTPRERTTTRSGSGTKLHTTSPTRTRESTEKNSRPVQRTTTPKQDSTRDRKSTTNEDTNRKPRVSTPSRTRRPQTSTPPPSQPKAKTPPPSRSRSSASSNRSRTTPRANASASRPSSSKSRATSRGNASSPRASKPSGNTSKTSKQSSTRKRTKPKKKEEPS